MYSVSRLNLVYEVPLHVEQKLCGIMVYCTSVHVINNTKALFLFGFMFDLISGFLRNEIGKKDSNIFTHTFAISGALHPFLWI